MFDFTASSFTQHTPALGVWVWALLALLLKTTLTSLLQVLSRIKAGVFPIPEDARLMRRSPASQEAPLVARCAQVWRNDTENLPLFLAVSLAYCLLGASVASAQLWLGAYVLLRWVHTGVYLAGLQPWRALSYLAGLALCWGLALGCAWRLLA